MEDNEIKSYHLQFICRSYSSVETFTPSDPQECVNAYYRDGTYSLWDHASSNESYYYPSFSDGKLVVTDEDDNTTEYDFSEFKDSQFVKTDGKVIIDEMGAVEEGGYEMYLETDIECEDFDITKLQFEESTLCAEGDDLFSTYEILYDGDSLYMECTSTLSSYDEVHFYYDYDEPEDEE